MCIPTYKIYMNIKCYYLKNREVFSVSFFFFYSEGINHHLKEWRNRKKKILNDGALDIFNFFFSSFNWRRNKWRCMYVGKFYLRWYLWLHLKYNERRIYFLPLKWYIFEWVFLLLFVWQDIKRSKLHNFGLYNCKMVMYLSKI